MSDNELDQSTRYFLRVDASNTVTGYATGMVEFLGMTEVSSDIFDQARLNIGFCTFDGATLTLVTPPAVAPSMPKLTARQLRLWLLSQGIKGSDVDGAIAKLPADQQAAAQIEWEYASDYERTNQLIPLLGAALGLSDAQIDAGFFAAAKL